MLTPLSGEGGVGGCIELVSGVVGGVGEVGCALVVSVRIELVSRVLGAGVGCAMVVSVRIELVSGVVGVVGTAVVSVLIPVSAGV